MEEGFIMEQQLREHLMEGEQLLWAGRPEAFETFDKTNKTSLVTGLIIKIAVALGLIVTYVTAQSSDMMKPGIIIVVLLFAAFAVINPFLVARRLRKKTIYGLTNKRVMRSGVYDEAVPYERIRSAMLRTDADGHTTLLCGPRAVNLKPRLWRAEADASFINNLDAPEAARVMFYAMPMSDELESLLEKYLPIR